MENSPFYQKQTNKSFDDAIVSLKDTAKKHGFNSVADHLMHNTFSNNGLDWSGNYAILSFCNPHKAHHALSTDLRLGAFMPKNIIVFENENKQVNIMLMKGDPDKMNSIFPGKNIGELSKGVMQTLITIIDESI